MKNLKELRDLILKNEGELKIGELRFKHEEGKDIDVYIGNRLILWIFGSEDENSKLDEVSATVAMEITNLDDKNSVENKLQEEIYELRNANQEKEKQIKNLKTELEADTLFKGKVEAYEKLLIGRDITIGK